MKYSYQTSGVCSRQINIDTDGETIKNIEFIGGCNGNTQGVSILCKGRDIDEVIELLYGIKCGFKNTSCPDQLARALKKMKEETAKI